MPPSVRELTATTAVALAALLLSGTAACTKRAESGGAGQSPHALAASSTGPGAATSSKLGDLDGFRSIANDVAIMVNRGDLTAAKARIKDLEVSWDEAEAGLKPRAAEDWHVLDKAIDRALAALRAGEPSQPDCKVAVTELLKTFDALQGLR